MREIFKIFVKAGVGAGVNLIIGLARNKVLALVLGPSGMGALSLLQQLQATALPIATLGGDSPLVQGLAARSGESRSTFLSSATKSLLVSWTLCTITIVLVAPWAIPKLFDNFDDMNRLSLEAMAAPVLFSAISVYLICILTAVGAVGSVQKGQIFGNIAGLFASFLLAALWKHQNSLALPIYLLAAPFVTAFAALYFVWKLQDSRSLLQNLMLSKTPHADLKAFLTFSMTTVFTGFIVTATWLAIRTIVARQYSFESLGFFSSAVTLSGLSLSLMGTALGSFYMPRFAAASALERPQLVHDVLKIVLPIAVIVFLSLQLFPEAIVQILFSNKFLPAIPLLRWWAAGDFVRTISYVFGHTIFAGRHLRFALISEVIFSGLLLTSISFSANKGQPIDRLGAAYFSVYTLHLLAVFIFAKKRKYC